LFQGKHKSWSHEVRGIVDNNCLNILEERKKKSAIGINGTNSNGTKPIRINQIDVEDQDNIDAIRGNEYKGQNFTPIKQKWTNDKQSHRGKMFSKCKALRHQNS
jgi:hypothetical protein